MWAVSHCILGSTRPASARDSLCPKVHDRACRIGRSKAGLGPFARVAIKKGQFIVRYSGRKIRTEVADELDTRYLFSRLFRAKRRA
jgi:hypothetical protein